MPKDKYLGLHQRIKRKKIIIKIIQYIKKKNTKDKWLLFLGDKQNI